MGFTNKRQFMVPMLLCISIFAAKFAGVSGVTHSYKNTIPGRHLLQTNDSSGISNISDDTVRVDPLDDFKKYRGGYNLTNKHYWSSTIFTGVYGYAIGLLWLLIGIVFGIFMLSMTLCGKSINNFRKLQKKSPCHKQCYLWPILTAFILTVLAIVAIGLVLGGNAKFHSRAKTIVNILIDTANDASETLYNTTGAINDISSTLEASNGSASTDTMAFLTSTSEKLDVEAADIQRQARKNRRLINKGLKIVYIVTTVTISLNLAAVIALSVCGFLRLRRPLKWLIMLCWLLTVLCWIFFGIYFFLDKFSSDTCTALTNFQQDPYNNSLSSILPCDDLLSAKPVLTDVSTGIYNLVNEVNANISHRQSTTNIMYVCNPFSGPPEYQYQPENCPVNTIRIGDIPKVLQVFTCSNPSTENCSNGEYISTSEYKTVEAYTSSIQNLLNAYPGMENLIECQSVKDAFSEILLKHCKPLKRYVHMVWAAMVFLSVIMVLLVIIWTFKATHEDTYQFSDSSVKPQSAMANSMESKTAKAIQDKSESSFA